MLKKILNWFKRKELERIAKLEARLSDAIKISNKKATIVCYNKKCMDYDPATSGCTLSKVIVTLGGKCEDFDDGTAMEEFQSEFKKNVFTVDGKPVALVT